MNISCRWKWPLLRYMIMDKDHKMQDLMQRSKWLRYFAATCSKGGEISPPLTCAYRCQHMLTCMKTYRRHIHSIMKTAWQQALEVESMLRSGGGRGAAVLPLSVVELMDREHRHMKHKDSEKMLSGVTLLQVYSTFTQQWKKRAKKKSRGRRWDENIATVVREWKMREGKSKARNESEWQILSTGYTRQGGFIWILHDLKHRKLAEWIIWQKVHPQMGSGLLMIGPGLLGAMQPAAIPKSSLHLPSFRVPNLSEAHNQSKQFTLSCTQIHTWSIGGKNACAKKKKKFKLKKYLKMVMAKTVKLRFSIYNEHMWLRQLTQS